MDRILQSIEQIAADAPLPVAVIEPSISAEALVLLDSWISEQAEPKPSRSEAIRRLVEEALKAKRL